MISKEDVLKVPESTEKGVPYCVGGSGELEEIIEAYMEGMIFALGLEEWPGKKIAEETLVSGGTELWEKTG